MAESPNGATSTQTGPQGTVVPNEWNDSWGVARCPPGLRQRPRRRLGLLKVETNRLYLRAVGSSSGRGRGSRRGLLRGSGAPLPSPLPLRFSRARPHPPSSSSLLQAGGAAAARTVARLAPSSCSPLPSDGKVGSRRRRQRHWGRNAGRDGGLESGELRLKFIPSFSLFFPSLLGRRLRAQVSVEAMAAVEGRTG